MPRRIRTVSLQSSGGPESDKFFDRVIKYVPADVVGAWVAATGIIASSGGSPASHATMLWVAFAFGLIFTAAWTYRQTSEPGKPTAALQIVVATLAFAVWVFALGGPFASLLWYQQSHGSLLLIAFSLVTGFLVPKD